MALFGGGGGGGLREREGREPGGGVLFWDTPIVGRWLEVQRRRGAQLGLREEHRG